MPSGPAAKIRKINKEFLEKVTPPPSPSDATKGSDGGSEPDVVPTDPACDPDHPKKITFSDVSSAAFNIKNGVLRTPCNKSPNLSKLLDMELYFKKEYLQVTGSFKERGARYALSRLSKEEKERGVIAASAGKR
ncbi:hypothetical protein ANCCAN_22429 [Ancylostoma caninum]|uniref:L-serine deaminase n=1 Tax=Ancylostoma caninum TaxID=29170 RepID=A0A368FHS5_ANCCA|nr:hypothetical protein ANCCAN_22429 [Ancylostoma caninum]